MELSFSDQKLLTDIKVTIIKFIRSAKNEMQMYPMNSYRRRIVHKISSEYKLISKSTGEGENRSVCLTKTSDTIIPERLNKEKTIDRGIEIFYAKRGSEIILRNDGSFGVLLKEREDMIIDRRLIEDGEFRIRDSKIVCKDDVNW